MRIRALLVIFLTCITASWAQEKKPAAPSAPAAPAAPTLESETIQEASPLSAGSAARTGGGVMEAAQVKELLQRVWLAEYRLNDLLTEVRPERWKLDEATRNSFHETLETLRRQVGALDAWRAQFDARPDSVYLAFETYTAIGAVLPRLDGVARSVSRHENPSLGAQFSQAGNQLFDLQQALLPHLANLLGNHDQVVQALRANLAACQAELSFAMRGKSAPAKPMENIRPDFKGRRKPRATANQAPTPQATAPPQPAPKKP